MHVAVALLLFLAFPSFASTTIDWWSTVRRGANQFSNVETYARFRAARDFGVTVVRLAPNKWLNGRPAAERGDFLLGPRDRFRGVVAADLVYLKRVLDEAERAGVKVVLTMLSLPHSRWSQHNNGVEQRDIWRSDAAQADAIRFWRELAAALRGHPALVGYNPRNEPSPEHVAPRLGDWFTADYPGWYARVKDTPADLNRFYRRIVAAIREVDVETPIVLDAGHYAEPWAFQVLEPVADARTLYSFHMYNPGAFTSHKNGGKIVYPGLIVTGEEESAVLLWNRAQVRRFFAPVRAWQRRHGIAANRVFAGELGVYRHNPGAEAYLSDVIAVLEEERWHWAFYSFREDDWDGMNYELGPGTMGETLRKALRASP